MPFRCGFWQLPPTVTSPCPGSPRRLSRVTGHRNVIVGSEEAAGRLDTVEAEAALGPVHVPPLSCANARSHHRRVA